MRKNNKDRDFRRVLLSITNHMSCFDGKVPEEIIVFSNTVAKKLGGSPNLENLDVALKEAEIDVMEIFSQKAKLRSDAKRYTEDVSLAIEMTKRIILDLAALQEYCVKKVA